jgi:flagella basal body P-ring formation protein FlgA
MSVMPMVRGQGPVRTRPRGWIPPSAWAALGAILVAVLPATAVLARDVVLPVPRVTVYPGSVITEAMLVDKAFRGRDYEAPGLAATRQELVGKVARTTLLPNTPIALGGIREPFAVQQGQPAVVYFKSGALIISSVALPLQPGAAGDVISLRNTDSGTTIRGVVQADGTVRVGLP